jgi:putative ABC transport system permease protein
MIIYNLKIALRNTFRNKIFSAINIFGLALGLAGVIYIMLWVWDEISYDRFNNQADNIFMLINKNTDDQGNSLDFIESPAPMSEYLVNNIPEIKKAVRIEYFYSGGLIQKGNDYFNEKGAAADASIFEIFTIPFIHGSKSNVFKNPESIVISEDIANRYYGEKNPVGEVLKIKGYGKAYKTVTITGVYKDFPGNSSLNFDFIIPFSLEEKGYIDNWGAFAFATFILLDKNADFKDINKKVASIYKDVVQKGQYSSYLFPLVNLHLYSSVPFFNIKNQGNIKLIKILIFIAILILLIACINYMNLSTAKYLKKVKEVSIKRILGINRTKLLSGFLSEAILFSLISFHIAIVIIEIIRPLFNHLTGKNITINYFEPHLLIGALIVIIFTGFISAIYPYVYITSKKPVLYLKGEANRGKKGGYIRKLLVIIQFAISIILIIYSSIIIKQVNYIYSNDLGFDKENILIINSRSLGDKVDVFKDEILKQTSITSVTNGNLPIGGGWADAWSWKGKESGNRMVVKKINSDSDYLKTLNIKLINGRFFSNEYNDSGSLVINQKFADLIGKDGIIGEKIFYGKKPFTIIGITDNFYSNHFSEEIQPVAFFNESHYWLLIKVKNSKTNETIDFLKSEFKKIVADRPFEYSTLQQEFDGLYSTEVKAGKLFAYFSILAIFISCLGLLGISVFAAEQRTKEIGIRKALGASSSNILRMLNSEFIKLVAIAYAIACPVAYYLARNWLQNFVFRTDFSWWIFAIAGAFVLIISLLTVSWQSYLAARRNPVESLRYE